MIVNEVLEEMKEDKRVKENGILSLLSYSIGYLVC